MRRILIIDDEDDIREVAALSLEATAGWQILTAASGSEGMAIAATEQPDAILMDVMMPGVDGPTTFREMQQNPKIANIPVLLLTAKVQPQEVEELVLSMVQRIRTKFADLATAGPAA